ncbi:MAG: helix-hairpin-helix domain-containing protein, partial [Myxococcota bacterium]
YHLHRADGAREVLGLTELVAAVSAAPEAGWLVWQPGWTAWSDPREIPELAEALGFAPPVPVPIPGPVRGVVAGAGRERAPLERVVVELIEVPPATFAMGPDREVTLTGGIGLAPPVTRAGWAAITGRSAPGDGAPDARVDQVSWFDAVQYCIALSTRAGLTSAYTLGEPRPRKAYSIDDIGRMLREVIPFKRVPAILAQFGTEALAIVQSAPDRLAEVPGIGAKSAEEYGKKWDRDKWFVRDVGWDRSADGFRLPTEAEWVHAVGAGAGAGAAPGDGDALDWVWDADPSPVYQSVTPRLPAGAFVDPVVDAGPRRIVRSAELRRALVPQSVEAGVGFRVVRTLR